MTVPNAQPSSNPAPRYTLDELDLAQRLALATPKDTCKGMFFNGVLLATERLINVDARKGLFAKAGGKKFVDFFNYPISDFLPLAFNAVELLLPKEGSWEAGFRRLGRQATDDFLATAVGKTLLLLANDDARRLMSSLPSGYKTAVSYGERQVVWSAAKTCTFKMRRDFMPHPYHEGVVEQVLQAVGANEVKVGGRRVGQLDTDYDVSWT
ncbi:MAG: TIGR02265 family protein [Myxococcaceae bacterium]